MTIWKASFDAHSATWHAFGRAVFVEAETEPEARERSEAAAQREYPGSQIEIDRIGESTESARAAFLDRKARIAEWIRRARTGELNDGRGHTV